MEELKEFYQEIEMLRYIYISRYLIIIINNGLQIINNNNNKDGDKHTCIRYNNKSNIKSHNTAQSVKQHVMRGWKRELTVIYLFIYYSTLRHPNIVSMIGYCKKANTLCLVIEYISGGSLDGVRIIIINHYYYHCTSDMSNSLTAYFFF